MDHALAVGIVQGPGHLLGIPTASAIGSCGSRASRCRRDSPSTVWHGEPEAAGGSSGIVNRQDVRVLKPRDQADLPLEALGRQRRGRIGMQNLEGDPALVLEVVRQVDRGHAAPAQLALDPVPYSLPVRMTSGVPACW